MVVQAILGLRQIQSILTFEKIFSQKELLLAFVKLAKICLVSTEFFLALLVHVRKSWKNGHLSSVVSVINGDLVNAIFHLKGLS